MARHLYGILLVSFIAMAAHTAAAPLRVLVIGDSLTEEYAFEVPFSAPDSNPAAANARNWPELLSAHRAADLTFDSYNSAYFSYPDLRNGGYKTNNGTLRIPLSQPALRFAIPVAEESSTLSSWQAVPASRISLQPDGSWLISPTSSTRGFYRLSATPRL
jgi:hypothetical protein